jgi:8-oxo-dGTP diphosphatase
MTTADVAIGIVEREGKVLICLRRKDARFGGFWEFPGGKCEPGEMPSNCLRRELSEEVGLVIEPTHAFTMVEHHYPNGPVRLHPFLCRIISGAAAPLAADGLRWVDPDALAAYDFPPANDPLLVEIVQYLRTIGGVGARPEACA